MTMKSASLLWILLFAALFSAARAQLIIDNGGPRDLLVSSKATGTAGLQTKIDTSDSSLSFSDIGIKKFSLNLKNVEDGVAVGYRGKVTAVDGIEELAKFDKWPKTEISGIASYYFHRKTDINPTSEDGVTNIAFHSLTLTLTGGYSEYLVIDNQPTVTPKKVIRESEATVSSNLTYSVLLTATQGMAVSMGYERSNNYSDLTKVEISETGGKLADGTPVEGIGSKITARLGQFKTQNAYPLYMTYVLIVQSNKIGDLIPSSAETSNYSLVIGPYFKVTPKESSKPTNAVGLNFTLRAQANTSRDGKFSPDLTKKDFSITYPYSFFVERRNVSNSAKAETKAGVGVVFTWK